MNKSLPLSILFFILFPVSLLSQTLQLGTPPQKNSPNWNLDTVATVNQQAKRYVSQEIHFEVKRLLQQSSGASERYFDPVSQSFSERYSAPGGRIRYRTSWYLDGEKPKALNRENRQAVRTLLQDRPESLSAFNRYNQSRIRSNVFIGAMCVGGVLAVMGITYKDSSLPAWQSNGAIVAGSVIGITGLIGGAAKWHKISKRLEETADLYNQGR